MEHIHADPYDDATFHGRARRAHVRRRRSRCTGGCAASPRRCTGRVRPLRVGRRRARVPGVDEPVALRPARAAGAGGGGRATVDDPRRRREGLPDRVAPRRWCSSTTPTPRTSGTRTSTGRTSSLPREWLIVRRILDGRRRIVVADDGLTLHHHGYTENLAHALAARGRSSRRGGRHGVQRRRRGSALGAPGRRDRRAPRSGTPSRSCRCRTTSRSRRARCWRSRCRRIVCSTSRAPHRPRLPRPRPRRATRSRATAHWLAEHPLEPGGHRGACAHRPVRLRRRRPPDRRLGVRARLACPTVPFARQPGYGMAYSGPGGRPRSSDRFVE